MRAALLEHPAPVDENPLRLADLAIPEAQYGEVLIQVSVCGVCRTDLHVVEGELAKVRASVVPGHQAVGTIAALGPGARRYQVGRRVGVAWLHRTCGICEYCRWDRENLCESALFTGYTANGGFAEYLTAPEDFVYAIPDGFEDLQAAPLLCAGIIGFRCLRISSLARGAKLGLYGFGAAAHVAIQVARHQGIEVYVCTRDQRHRDLAHELGCTWFGAASEPPPVALDAAIIFAPAGELVPPALRAVKRGGVVVLGGIHMSDIPSMPYELLYGERVLRSVANNTRQDGHDFLETAARIPIRPRVEVYPLSRVNQALQALKHDAVRGAIVLEIDN
jgi:propanol-preferring alcohol dehydrogenase